MKKIKLNFEHILLACTSVNVTPIPMKPTLKLQFAPFTTYPTTPKPPIHFTPLFQKNPSSFRKLYTANSRTLSHRLELWNLVCAGTGGHRVEVRAQQALDQLLRGGWDGAAALQHHPNAEERLVHRPVDLPQALRPQPRRQKGAHAHHTSKLLLLLLYTFSRSISLALWNLVIPAGGANVRARGRRCN